MSQAPDSSRMLDLATDAARRARQMGADFADVTVQWGRQANVLIEASDIRLSEQDEHASYSVRAIVRGGMGLASGNGWPADRLPDRLADAVQMARLASPDPQFVDLPGPQSPLATDDQLDLYDPAIADKTLADAVRIARTAIERAADLDSGVLLNGEASFSVGASVLASSTGIALTFASTFAELSLFGVARDNGDVGSFSEFTMARHWADLRLDELPAQVCRGARMYQHARHGPTRPMTLLLSPLAAYALTSSLAAATSAESIRRKRSLLAGRLGQQIASAAVTLHDRPLERRGVYSGAFDGEGSPRLPVLLLDRGVFAESLTNHYNARLARVRNNGHGARRGSIHSSNLHLTPGDAPQADLLAQIDDGVYLHAGSLDPDLSSGDFSAVLDFAYKIDRGELAYPLAGAMASGNLFDLLAHIDAVSSDYRSEPGLVLPAVRIRDVMISGEA